MGYDYSLDDISDMLRDRVSDIAEDCIQGGRRNGNYWTGDCGGKCSVHIGGAKVGMVGFWQGQNPRNGSNGGTLIDLIQLAHGCSSAGDAIKLAKSKYLNLNDDYKPSEQEKQDFKRKQQQRHAQRDRDQARASAKKKSDVMRIWNDCKPAGGTLAEQYLMSRMRGFKGKFLPPTIRFHPSLPYSKDQRFPALVAGVQNSKRKLTAVWRIYLSEDGGKAVSYTHLTLPTILLV